MRSRLLVLALMALPLSAGTLTIGSGTADIPEGTSITIHALPAPSGKVFDRWTGDTGGVADVTAADTTLTMPAGDVSLTATYKDVVLPPPPPSDTASVSALMETDPVGDPDDMWLWENPNGLGGSLLFSTDKLNREIVWYDLNGEKLGSLYEAGRPNNIDGRGNIMVTNLRNTAQLAVFEVSSSGPTLVKTTNNPAGAQEPYGLCVYKSPTSGKLYAFCSGYSRNVYQTDLETGQRIRTIHTSLVEGLCAHDASGRLFIAQENGTVLVIGAEPGDGDSPTTVASGLPGDLEGVAVVGDLYVIVSLQGISEFAVFDLNAPFASRGRFQIVGSGDIDGTSATDGIAWHAGNYGATFPSGIFFAHDDENGTGRNIKAVPWEKIAAALGLATP